MKSLLILILLALSAIPVFSQARTASQLEPSTVSNLNVGSPPLGAVRYAIDAAQTSGTCVAAGVGQPAGAMAQKLATGWTCSAFAGGAGTGSVTSFSAGTLSPLFTTSVSSPTVTPALSFVLSTQTANRIFAGPASGSAAAPTFRALTATDVVSGTITNSRCLRIDSVGAVVVAAADCGAGSGAVDSVFGRTGVVIAATNDYTWAQIDKTTSSLANLTTRSASDLSSGTLPDARFPATLPAASGVNLTALNATNLGSGTVPDARFPATLPAASGVNLTALNASNLASGTTVVARGGTGLATVTADALVKGNGTSAMVVSGVSVDSGNNVSTAGSVSTGVGGAVAGNVGFTEGTATAVAADTVSIAAPVAVTGYRIDLPAAAGNGVLFHSNSSNVVTQTFVNAETLLATDTAVNMDTATATTLYTCPTGKTCVITRVIVSTASTSLTTASYSFGWTTAAFADVIANATHTELTGATLYTVLIPKVGATLGTSTGTFKVLMNTLQGGAATARMDVFGFYY